MDNRITLTREEVREAREVFKSWCGVGLKSCFLDARITCGDTDACCHLCKRLTEFAKGEEDE